MQVEGNIVDIENRAIFKAQLEITNGVIGKIEPIVTDKHLPYILPGFIDAHVHIESSMLTPSEFARLAVVHGTVATVSDPHEIGNVMGKEGVKYMIESGKKVNFKFYFGVPSCVPATVFETAGARISVNDIRDLFETTDIKYLAEMMNWPGVLNQDPEVMEKIKLALKYGKKVDGHAPGLKGEDARKYIAAGITTDHECFTAEEALDKLKYGMKILIREGSAAKNFEALIPLIDEHYENMMFCSDDKHPDNLVEGHINLLVKRAVHKGFDMFKVLKAACINPIDHYGLEVGKLREGDAADFIIVSDLNDFNVEQTYINGRLVADNGSSKIPYLKNPIINNFNINKTNPNDFRFSKIEKNAKLIEALDNQLITNRIDKVIGEDQSPVNINHDILKIAVVNRYDQHPPSLGLIKNFNLKEGAIASSVAHDSHNIIAVGVDDDSICNAVNLIDRKSVV
jgi:adenine deaminase